MKLTSADNIAAELTGAILKNLSPRRGQEAILLVNGFGGTAALELYVMVHAVRKLLSDHGLNTSTAITITGLSPLFSAQ